MKSILWFFDLISTLVIGIPLNKKFGGKIRRNYKFFNEKKRDCTIELSERVTDNKPNLLAKALNAINGIENVYVLSYNVEIRRADSFRWMDLVPEIDKVILEQLSAV